jgi:hypothetical protein
VEVAVPVLLVPELAQRCRDRLADAAQNQE